MPAPLHASCNSLSLSELADGGKKRLQRAVEIASRVHIQAAVIAKAIDDIECTTPGGADAAGNAVEVMAKASRLGGASTAEVERDIAIIFAALGATGQIDTITFGRLSSPTQKALKAILNL